MNAHVVELDGLGRLQGVLEKSVDGDSYLAFKGVPYAKPPLGKLRFADPVPPEPWTGIREAAKYGDSCAQYDEMSKKYIGSEDCLYLNVYVPLAEIKRHGKFSVMVWVHGGAFIMGSGDNFMFGPDYLLKKDVIVVTINYRLGVFGFLNLEHRVAPGNQGLKDQVAALRWVQQHIEAFGGDKNNVTIFGESAGGANVHYLTLSPLAEGLFHKAIAQSGSVFCPWASSPKSPKTYAIWLLEHFDRKFSNEQEAVDFLRSVDCAKLVEAEVKLRTGQKQVIADLIFVPGPDEAADQPFLPNFVSTIENGVVKVPLIIGYTSGEGIIFSQELNESKWEAMNADFGSIVQPAAIKWIKNLTPADVKRAYFGDEPLDSEKSLKRFVEMSGDLYFVNGIYKFAQIQASESKLPTYLYRYSFVDEDNPMQHCLNPHRISGAPHGAELMYLFFPHGFTQGRKPLEKGSKERILVERLTQMWTDFAKTGNPIPAESEFVKTSWKPVKEANELHYLEINEELSPGLNPDAARLSLWNKLSNK